MRANVVVINDGASRINVDPEAVSLWVLKPYPHSLKYQKPAALTASIRGKARLKAALLVWSGSLAKSTYTSNTSASGSFSGRTTGSAGTSFEGGFNANATTITTGPNYVAQMRANELADRLMANAISDAEYIQEITLKANTVLPGAYAAGAVYFEREKHYEAALLTVMAGGYTFEFPLP